MTEPQSSLNVELSAQDIEAIIENKALFEKYINVAINTIRIDFANLKYIEKAHDGELAIRTLIDLRQGMNRALLEYKAYIEELENNKEETKELNKEELEVAEIKKRFNI